MPEDPAPTPTPPPPMPKGVLALFGGSLAMLAIALLAWWIVSRPPAPYPASGPDEMLDSMAAAVQEGNAERLVEFVDLAPPDATEDERLRYRDLAIRLARVLERAESLARITQGAFPDEIATLRADIESGRSSGLLAELARAAREQGGGFSVGRGDGPPTRDELSTLLGSFMADPFHALEEGRARLSTLEIDDQTAMLQWDEQPILPPFGLIAREGDDGRWRLIAPTSLPIVSRAMPKSEDEFLIWGSLLASVENLLDDLASGIRSGEIRSVDELARVAVRESVVPLGMVMVAYSQAVRARGDDADSAP